MEKDLRLQDLDDPYRPVRRERSRSFDSSNHEQQRRARERAERRNADLDPEVVLNTKYNAQNLKYHSPTDNQHHISSSRPHPPTRHMSSGYATDVQPVMLRRNSTQTTVPGLHHHHSSSSSSRHATSSRSDMPLKGWFNRRGDQFIDKNTVICQPMDRQFSSRFKGYPEVGQGYGDSNGNIIDVQGRLIKRIG
ncbi:hypothetical protein FRB91_005698 [Serendipita sp. 411]|nr:hypothetical protein FRC18_003729 [Serendipita sp. 400]KAG8840766.1 hypothetical protein FRB91_005698 [Serendipita sp. 411]